MTAGRVVAVTGATGFLGRHLVAALAHEGARIRILARRDPADDIWPGASLEVVPGGLEDEQALARLTAGADAVVHVAGLIKAGDRATFLRTNRDGTRAVAQAARRHAAAARFVAVSSLAAREPQLSAYAASKRAGEEAARAVYAGALDRLTIVRPPAIYGERDRETLVIFKAAARPVVPLFGSGRVALVHVADAAAAVARLAMDDGTAGLYALADPNPAGYSMREILGEAARAVGGEPHFVPLPGRILAAAGLASAAWGRLCGRAPIFSADKAREMLHPDWSVSAEELLPAAVYRSEIGIIEGFRRTVAWYRAAGWLI